MFDPKDVHVILIGSSTNVKQYRVNMELLRLNFSFGNKLWITTVYNDDLDVLPTGIGENTFLYIPENRGYAYGAIDAINKGFAYARLLPRDIVMLFNFDVLFFSEEGFVKCIEDFLASDLLISAAQDSNGLLATDCLVLKRSFVQDIGKIESRYASYREGLEIAERYKATTLGFENVEEWLWNALLKYSSAGPVEQKIIESLCSEERDGNDRFWLSQDVWHHMQRTDLPRLRWEESLGMGHLHELEEITSKLKQYGVEKGPAIRTILGLPLQPTGEQAMR